MLKTVVKSKCLKFLKSNYVIPYIDAGKTAVAEYAIAKALKHQQRVIYTSPIKALSNQKYRELLNEFKDVGLMTGDTVINPNASCIVMTTEIARDMLYKGSLLMNEVAWVIFDEIHYMRNKQRGVVWEETIILLSDKIRYLFLSATIPNASDLGLWVAKLHKQPVAVVHTNRRPTPLHHYVFPFGGDGIHLVADADGNFLSAGFNRACRAFQDPQMTDAEVGLFQRPNKKGRHEGTTLSTRQQKNSVRQVVELLVERDMAPLIIFSFGKKECEAHALAISGLDCTEEIEKLVEAVFFNIYPTSCHAAM